MLPDNDVLGKDVLGNKYIFTQLEWKEEGGKLIADVRGSALPPSRVRPEYRRLISGDTLFCNENEGAIKIDEMQNMEGVARINRDKTAQVENHKFADVFFPAKSASANHR
jgi:hypothetical protein